MTRTEFSAWCKTVHLLDGATGSMLRRAGMPAGVCSETWILDHPQTLTALQRAYLAAGSEIIYAPTFGANRVLLGHHDLQREVRALNRDLVQLGREAVGTSALLAGDMTTTGRPVTPGDDSAYETLLEIYREQVEALLEAGVDLFAVETMMGVTECMAAIEAIRSLCETPILCTLSVYSDGKCYFDGSAEEAAELLPGLGADAVGINCSSGPDQMGSVVRMMHRAAGDTPIAAKPNAGLPERVDGGVVYHCPPEEFAAYARAFAAAGVRIFGGCCGTTPAHIAALREALAEIDFAAFPAVGHDPDVIPCASEKEARFITPDVDVGETIACTSDLMEDILEAEEEAPQGALKIAILEEDDLDIFAENQYAVKDALCLFSDVPELLEKALRLYQGRAFWDGTGDLDEAFLEEMRVRYGLVLL